MKIALEIKDLTIERSGTVILNRLSWTARRGEHWVILGANGSGKTSLLSALTGYLTPTDGHIRVLDKVFGEDDWRELRLHIGLVSSAIRQKIPDWDSAELVVISGKYAMLDYWGPVRRADRIAAARILKQVECEHLLKREWGVLSQGERQRVLIGRALMCAPRLLILDEPCAGLDPVARETFLAFLQRMALQKRGPGLVFVTHHVEEIVPALSHVLILRQGGVLAVGEKAQVLTSANLSKAYGAELRLKRSGESYSL